VPTLWDDDSDRERLAGYIHNAQWSGWMKYLFSKCTINADGTATLPRWAVTRWTRQVNTVYKLLPEEEKDNDRDEADAILALLRSGLTSLQADAAGSVQIEGQAVAAAPLKPGR
jgi:hypothetical protein